MAANDIPAAGIDVAPAVPLASEYWRNKISEGVRSYHEVGDAISRHHRIDSVSKVANYAPTNNQAMLQLQHQMNTMQGQLQDQMNAMQDQMNAMQEQMNAMQAQMNTMLGQMNERFDIVDANLLGLNERLSQMNADTRARLARDFNHSITDYEHTPIRLIVKCIAGHPTPIPPRNCNVAFNGMPYNIGDFPPNDLLPTTLNEFRAVNSVTVQRMRAIYWFYNDPRLAALGDRNQNLQNSYNVLFEFLRKS